MTFQVEIAILLLLLFIVPAYAKTTEKTKTPDIKICGDWQLEIKGDYKLSPKTIKIPDQKINVEKPELIEVKNEEYPNIGIFNPEAAFWCQGVRINGVSNGETGSKGTLIGDSVVVKGDKEGKVIYVKDKDYGIGAEWGFFGRLNVPTSDIKEGSTVYVDYKHTLLRIDTIAVDEKGKLSYHKGKPAVQLAEPVVLEKGLYPVVNIFTRNVSPKLNETMLYPISELAFPVVKTKLPVIATKLPNSYKKLVNGEPIRILFWGDSVTAGGSVSDYEKYVWHKVALREIQKKYPKSQITSQVTSWGGMGLSTFLNTPIGQNYNFKEHVMDFKPDLVIMEFVNDTYQFIKAEDQEPYYKKVRDTFAANNIDWIIVAPHFTWFDADSFKDERYKASQRWYDAWVKKMADTYPNIAVADSSTRWEHLQYQGIPFCTLNVNGINHPNNKGHQLLADGVIALF